MSVLVSNIQRMCMHDGPGIRTTIFLKGCNLRCPWCANPENIVPEKQLFWDEQNCRRANGTCIYNSECPAVCKDFQVAGHDVESVASMCPLDALGSYGTIWTAEKLFTETLKDKVYWGKEGGVTFSGGEPLLQIYQLQELMDLFQKNEISMAMETALFTSKEAVKLAMNYISFFYVDIKILEENSCRQILGGSVERYLENVELLLLEFDEQKVVFRIPCSTQYVLTERNIEKILSFLKRYRKYSVELLYIHHMAEKKYNSLQKKMYKYNENMDAFNEFYLRLKQEGLNVKCMKV